MVGRKLVRFPKSLGGNELKGYLQDPNINTQILYFEFLGCRGIILVVSPSLMKDD